MAAQTPYQAFCTWQKLLATMSVQVDRDAVGIPILNWFGAACVRARNGNVQRMRSSLAIEWGSVLPDRSLFRWATKRLAPFHLPLPLQQPYSGSGRSNVGQTGWLGLGARELDLPFSRMTKTMRDSNPAPRPQLALLVSCITAAAAARFQNRATLKQQAVADLIKVAFFFLLRVGKYTMPTGNRRTRTVQFRCQDVRLWRFGQLLDHTAPLEHLLQADGVTLHIDNQKNGQRGQTVHHSAVNAWFCPAKACARRVHEIRSAGLLPDTPLSFFSKTTPMSSPLTSSMQ